MGLDMYLDRKEETPGENVAYWRKANMVHKWFVDNVQGGEDDCGSYKVDINDLKELLELCKELYKSRDPEQAESLLPTQEGFFFGSYEYDEFYWEDIKETIEQLERIIKEDEESNIEYVYTYSSSW